MVGIWLDIAGKVLVEVNHVYNANNVNAGKFAGSETWSVAGLCSTPFFGLTRL